MVDISFERNIREWTASLERDRQQHVPRAIAMALNQTAWEAREEHYRLLPTIFDRPTRFTMRSLYFTRTRPGANDQVVTVGFKDSNRFSRHYLLPNVEGGSRPHKRFEYWLIQRGIMRSDEFAVPARGVRLDASGNLPGSIMTQILSQLAASPDAGQWETVRSRAGAGAKRARYFAPRQGLPRGIWRRQGKAVSPVLMFVGSPSYSPRYRFDEITRAVAEMRFPLHLDEALQRLIEKGPR